MASLKDDVLDTVFFEMSGIDHHGDWDLEENDVTYRCVTPEVKEGHKLYCIIVATPDDPVSGDPDETKARFFRLSITEVPKP